MAAKKQAETAKVPAETAAEKPAEKQAETAKVPAETAYPLRPRPPVDPEGLPAVAMTGVV